MSLVWLLILLAGIYCAALDYKEAPVYIKPIIITHLLLLVFLMIISKLV